MGKGDQGTLKSDSGYGDDASVSSHNSTQNHPLSRKGYEIGPAANLQVGDVFEFLWADAPEFDWEWKCLGYTRFIVLRHSDTFPHHCACIPISIGARHDFAKPGIDHYQQGFVFANGERNPGCEQPGGGPKLPYSAVGIELRPGRLRVKEDSRANYADIVEIDHDAQVMVVGDVAMYFDRVRRNVNRAFMRQILRKALEEYKNGKAQTSGSGPGPAYADPGAMSSSGGTLPVISESMATHSVIQPVERRGSVTPSQGGALLDRSDSEGEVLDRAAGLPKRSSSTRYPSRDKRERDRDYARRRQSSVSTSTPSQVPQRPCPPVPVPMGMPMPIESSRPMRGAVGPGAGPPVVAPPPPPSEHGDYDLRSMHNVAMAGLK